MLYTGAAVVGSSPLTRGKHVAEDDRVAGARLIPAHAGKTGGDEGNPHGSGAHPRSRGENGLTGCGDSRAPGSSPLTRGKPGRGRLRRRSHGLIPAHAGKTRQ